MTSIDFLSLVLGTLFPFLINRLKKVGLKAGQAYLFLSCVAGSVYIIFDTFIPTEIKGNVLSILWKTVGSSLLIYEFLLKKNFFKDKKKNG